MSCTNTEQSTRCYTKGVLAGWLSSMRLEERGLGSNPSRSMVFKKNFLSELSLLQHSAPIYCSGDSFELMISSAKYVRVDYLYRIFVVITKKPPMFQIMRLHFIA